MSWDRDDPSDYLSAGFWIHFPDQRWPNLEYYTPNRSVYLFIDGPELDPRFMESMPNLGTATYSGGTGGRFLYFYDEDTYSDEEIAGIITLQADFAAGTIGGCIGCVGDLKVQRLHLADAYKRFAGDTVPLTFDPKDYEVHLAPTPYRSDGTFETTEGVTVRHPERTVMDVPYAFWGGGFSNRRDSAGNPRLVSGFGQAVFEEEGDAQAIIITIFNALSEDFRRGK